MEFQLRKISDQLHADGNKDAAVDVTHMALRLSDSNEESTPPRFKTLPISAALPDSERVWRLQTQAVREEVAKQLYILARKALRNSFPTLAYEIVEDVLRIEPDHRLSRGVIGQQFFVDRFRKDDPTYAGEWASPYEVRKRSGSRAEINHPEFGWIPSSHKTRYEQGERPWRNNWISKEKEQEIRRKLSLIHI